MKAVSTNPVKGSATRENKTGIDRVTNVLWGAFLKGWSTDISGLDSKRSVLSSPKKLWQRHPFGRIGTSGGHLLGENRVSYSGDNDLMGSTRVIIPRNA
jgi:hypothetical protein